MKIRDGYVSNSSSSSFVVLGIDSYNELSEKNFFDSIKTVGYELFAEGCCEFGWQVEEYFDSHSKLNWALLQAECARSQGVIRPMNLLVEIFKQHGVDLNWRLVSEASNNRSAYIDHQSLCTIDTDNCEIFNDEKTLRLFLFGSNSYVRNDNDNH